MKKIGIIVHTDKDIDGLITNKVVEIINSNGAKAILDSAGLGNINLLSDQDIVNSSDFIITVGGDGTFLNAARKTIFKDVPIIGINLGRLGFLTEIEVSDLERSVIAIINGEYIIKKRMLLKVEIKENNNTILEDYAVNDVTLSRLALSRIIIANVIVDGVMVSEFPGDGVIISTPMGSTGYALSAGGAVIKPDMELMEITPICPHTLHSRSYIIPPSSNIKISSDQKSMITIDGQNGCEITQNNHTIIKRSEHYLKIAVINQTNFFDKLRKKMSAL